MPKSQGLYKSRWEHDGCGIGAVVRISGRRDHSIIEYGGDGAGILFQIPHKFLQAECNQLGFFCLNLQ
jgi:glutamate synthase (ferredoxin)